MVDTTSNVWITVAGISGAAAVALGAVGSHGVDFKSEQMRETWKTASHYHLLHTLALALSAVAFPRRKRNIVCGLLSVGTLLFSGTCYVIAYTSERKPYASYTPMGGMALIAGWLGFAVL